MKNRASRCAALLVFAAGLLIGTSAGAQETAQVRESDRGLTYEFLDDGLLGGGLAPRGGSIVVKNRTMRLLLIRPRTHFVDTLLKSVENL